MMRWLVAVMVAIAMTGCAGRSVRREAGREISNTKPRSELSGVGATQRGVASWYGDDWQGKATASGERFNKRDFTAAHRTIRMGSQVQVTSSKNGKTVVVRINDRGPYDKSGRRIIDLSEAAAKKLDMIDDGLAPVTIQILSQPPPKRRN